MGTYVAVDLGATSGRVVLGTLRDGRFDLHEVHRFPNEPLGSGRSRVWDVEELFAQTLVGLGHAARQAPGPVAGVGVTAWGVDAGVLGADGRLRGPVPHYRSAAPDGADDLLARLGGTDLYARTGVLPQPMNTVFRLRRLVDGASSGGPRDDVTVLLVPDLWCALLTGERGAERSIAGTTGLVSLGTGTWDTDLLAETGVDAAVLPPVCDNGQVVGTVGADVRARTGAGADWPFVRTASHDTASAVAAVSGRPGTAFLSAGTWSLVGVERHQPVVTPEALAAGFTNEAGWGRTSLFMRNLTGLWLVEQAVRQWRAQGLHVTVPELMELATEVGPVPAAVDVTATGLVHTDDVLGALRALCASAGMPVPSGPAEVTRCIAQSLALTYRRTLELCEALTGEPVEAVRMVGGGTRNALLRRLTADACARPLLVGPVEGTSLGSVATQALAVGELSDEAEMRAVLGRSVTVYRVDPSPDRIDRAFWQHLDSLVPTPWSAP